jgi:hypothetical protein
MISSTLSYSKWTFLFRFSKNRIICSFVTYRSLATYSNILTLFYLLSLSPTTTITYYEAYNNVPFSILVTSSLPGQRSPFNNLVAKFSYTYILPLGRRTTRHIYVAMANCNSSSGQR